MEYNLQEECGLDIWAENRIPQNLWVESVSNQNILCILSTKNYDEENVNSLDEFVIDCYYIQKDIYQTIATLEFSPEYKINIEIYTQDINKNFIKDGATDIGKG